VHMVLSGKEQALTDRELAEAFFLLAGQLEDVGQHVNRGWRLLEQNLHTGVGHNRPSHT
jgi:hypothetical protein